MTSAQSAAGIGRLQALLKHDELLSAGRKGRSVRGAEPRRGQNVGRATRSASSSLPDQPAPAAGRGAPTVCTSADCCGTTSPERKRVQPEGPRNARAVGMNTWTRRPSARLNTLALVGEKGSARCTWYPSGWRSLLTRQLSPRRAAPTDREGGPRHRAPISCQRLRCAPRQDYSW